MSGFNDGYVRLPVKQPEQRSGVQFLTLSPYDSIDQLAESAALKAVHVKVRIFLLSPYGSLV